MHPTSLPQFNTFMDPRSGHMFPPANPASISQLVAPPPLDGPPYSPELFAELTRAAALSGFHFPAPHDNLPYPIFGIPPPLYGVRQLR